MKQHGNIPYNLNTEQIIYEAIRTADKPLNIKEIAQKTGYHRNTVRNYIKVLYMSNRIVDSRTIGNSTLYTTK